MKDEIKEAIVAVSNASNNIAQLKMAQNDHILYESQNANLMQLEKALDYNDSTNKIRHQLLRESQDKTKQISLENTLKMQLNTEIIPEQYIDENNRLNKNLHILQNNYEIIYAKYTDLENNNSKEYFDILVLACWLWLLDYNRLRLFLLNRISEIGADLKKSKDLQKYTEEDYDIYKKFMIAFYAFFPFNAPKRSEENTLLVYEPNFTRVDIQHLIDSDLSKNLFQYEEYGFIYLKITLNTVDIVGIEPFEDLSRSENGIINQMREKVQMHMPDFSDFIYEQNGINMKQLYIQKSYYGTLYDNLDQFLEDHLIKIRGGVVENLISTNILNYVSDKHRDEIGKFINDINIKFKELCKKYCINCSIEEKISKLIELFKINSKTEKDIYENHNLSIRDLNLYVYLNMVEFIKNSIIKTSYKKMLINIIESFIIEHINYGVWFFMFSNNYTLDKFREYLHLGKFKVEEIIQFIRHKEEQKFSKINKKILETFYRKILIIYIYDIKIARDVFNTKKYILHKTKMGQLMAKYKTNKTNKYDYKFFKSKLRQQNIYDSLLKLNDIRDMDFDTNKYKKNIMNLFNTIVNIIIFYRNLYIFINNIYKFFSISSLRTVKELKYNMLDFSSYLKIDTFMKKHTVYNKTLTLDSFSILCRNKKDFNLYINKLIEKINNMNLDTNLLEQWDLLRLKLYNLDIFTSFEIECIKLVVAINYNKYLLLNSNKYVKTYNTNKTLFINLLENVKIEFKKITKYNKNIHKISKTFTKNELGKLINFNNYLHFIIV